MKHANKFFTNIKIDEQILDRINKIEEETKHSAQLDLNRQVEDLLGGSSDYKNLERSRAEFPMSSRDFYKEDIATRGFGKASVPSAGPKSFKMTPKVFEVERLTRQQRAEVILQSFLSKDSASLSSNSSCQGYAKKRWLESKLKEIELTERHSVITTDKSNLSFAIQTGAGHDFVHGDMLEEIDDLLCGKKAERDYYSSINMLSGVALPGLSSDSGLDDDFGSSSNAASRLWFDQEDWAWEARDNDMMFI